MHELGLEAPDSGLFVIGLVGVLRAIAVPLDPCAVAGGRLGQNVMQLHGWCSCDPRPA